MKPRHRWTTRLGATWLLAGAVASAWAVNTATIVSSALSPDCLAWRVVGICYWLDCGLGGCRVRTSVKVRHYIPEAVVSSYSDTGQNPWTEVRLMSPANTGAQAGGDGTPQEAHEDNQAKFKNADAIGHPAGEVFGRFASEFGYTCEGAAVPFMPYLLSTLDTVAWRYNLPESLYPEALVPGRRDVGSLLSGNSWGSVYPRGGFLHQVDDYKTAAVVAQRAGDVITRRGQIHVYQPLLASSRDGYWPAGVLIESDSSTGKWQELTPRLSSTCATFPHADTRIQAPQGDYAWALWRPYSCCKRRGQVFLGSIDF
ncbi:TIGR03756 family integrating conjugative element protein [Achromobacter xylosoxidans]